MADLSQPRANRLEEMARTKMVRVLGAARAEQLYDEVLRECGLGGITTPEHLLAFARALARRPGFEGTVGTMLSVQAVMSGAR